MSARAYVDERVVDVVAAERAAHEAADHWGFDTPVALRHGMNLIFRSGGVVLRVGRTNAPAECSLALADVLRRHDVPIVDHVRDDVVRSAHLSVTAWRHHDPGGPIDWHAVGDAVRRVHRIDAAELPPDVPLPSPTSFPWWGFQALLDSVGDALDDDARAGIEAALDRHAGWDAFADDDTVPTVVCHGDVHPGNVVQTADGPLLIDWDLLCRAPVGWDHAPLMTWEERWGGDPATYERFAHGYGWSGSGDRLSEAFAELRLVAATLMRLKAGLADEGAMPQAQERLRYWRGDPDAPVWRAV